MRCLQVVLPDLTGPKDFAEYTKRLNLNKGFWAFFVNDYQEINYFFASTSLPYSMEILAVVLNGKNAEIFDLSRASIKKPLRVERIGSWTENDGLSISQLSVYRRRSNFELIPIKIGLVENWPSAYRETEKGKPVWKGLFPNIWHHLEEEMNVTTIYHKALKTGSQQPDGTWTGVIGMAMKDEIDVIVSELTMNGRRSQALDFSQPLFKSKYQIYFKLPGFALDWTTILKPFTDALWSAILIWLLIASITYHFCYHVAMKSGVETDSNPSEFHYFIFFTIQSLSQQGENAVPKSLSCRIFFVSSYLLSALIVPCYSASLIYSLTKKTPNRPFNTVSEMLAEGSHRLLVNPNAAEFDYFADSQDPTLTEAFTKLIQTVPPIDVAETYEVAMEKICKQPSYAFFGIDSIVARRVERMKAMDCQIISMMKPLSDVHLGLALKKNNPLQGIIYFHLSFMIEFGLLNRLSENVWRLPRSDVPETWQEVRLDEVFQIFALLAFAMGLSVIILVLERMTYARKNKITRVIPFDSDYQYVN